MASHNSISSADVPVAIKITIAGKDDCKKFRLSLKDLSPTVLPNKLRGLLAIPHTKDALFERFSDSSASFVTLDSSNPSVYKQLYRAAKAKGKLRLRATITNKPDPTPEMSETPIKGQDRLPSRSYVHPYVSDSGPDQTPSSRISTIEDLKTLSAAPSTVTLAPSTKSNVEANKEQPPVPPSYFWPITENGGFSDVTRCSFEKMTPVKMPYRPHQSPKCERPAAESDGTDEAPVPHFFSHHEQTLAQLAEIQHQRAAKACAMAADVAQSFTIYCNQCDQAALESHWHCGICDAGDFDLCADCVKKGVLCENEEHWLIKRYVKDGKVINSTTETMTGKKPIKQEEKKEIPGAFTADLKTAPVENLERTCNSCVQVFHESKFVTCKDCDDYDLCLPCHVSLKHGHHPAHRFEPAVKDTPLDNEATKLLAAGRGMRHWAVCDGCDKAIHGIRHKCLDCPDWDYCSECAVDCRKTHPGHRFITLHERIQQQYHPGQIHHGISCDGPLCEAETNYITGDRYKCAVCHDTDFCARCEALPTLKHNRTHPLLKFRTPVRKVSVSTYGEKGNGEPMHPMGDQPPRTSSKSTETRPAAPSTNAATQVQTVAEVKPSSPASEKSPRMEKVKCTPRVSTLASTALHAHFVRDTVADGTFVAPGSQFTQIWTLRNQGPRTWPAGCSVCFVGGDSMLNVDSNHPSPIGQLCKALATDTIERPVDKGEEINFTVTMRAPEREGKAISYWRLKTADGTPFGHRLWCDVNVRKGALPESKRQETAKTETIKTEVETPIKKEEEGEETPIKEEEEGEQVKESRMIFPTLEKESPVSSTHEAAPSAADAPPAPAPATAATLAPAEQDLLEEVESLELDDDEESDEGFLTDEEYELIASGDEIEVAKNGKK